jgi:hypothetical protein
MRLTEHSTLSTSFAQKICDMYGRPLRGKKDLLDRYARSRVLTCVRPHECSGSHAAGPYGSSRIGSKSEPRASRTGFPDPISPIIALLEPIRRSRRVARAKGVTISGNSSTNVLFRGKAQCNACHRDGEPGEDPLFTDFTAGNIGTPANPQPSPVDQRWVKLAPVTRREFRRRHCAMWTSDPIRPS